MEYEIEGKFAQIVRLGFSKADECWASKGSLTAYDPAVNWELKVPGGVGGAARRVLSGEGVTLTRVRTVADNSEAILASNEPGKIIDWNLDAGPVLTTRGSFVGAYGPAVDIDVIVTRRAGAAFFGGAGLFLQKISGQGVVFIHGAGDFIEYELDRGQSIMVSTGNLAAFADSVDYDIQRVGGVRRALFGGEGLFMTKLTGPGRVLLQSLKRMSGSSGQAT
ncbi:MAG: AIM24 family protein [Acidobacteriota bacterium]|nr:MAG: AIM24 family protein [Acidobacteriota bacterium]